MKQLNRAAFVFLLAILVFSLLPFSLNMTGSCEDKKIVSGGTTETKPNTRTIRDKKLLDAMRFRENWKTITDRESWRRFAATDGDCVELVIGLQNHHKNEQKALAKLISKNKGKIVDRIKIQEETKALVVKIPFDNIKDFAETAMQTPSVKYVEPNAKIQVDLIPNDPGWPKQWGPAKIQADFAWNTTLGSSSVLVAVVDTGVDYTHPDLQANYVPLGYDWYNNDSNPMDDHGHGTHCAGIIAAVINNNEGMAGLAQVKVMAEKGLSASGSGSDDDLAKAIIHATDQGAHIISMSWGGYFDMEILHEALRYAYDRGVLLVAAAGNDPYPVRHYPACYDEVIAVAATNKTDTIASFSTYGDWVDVSAPGVKIYSTISKNHTWNIGYPYDNASGTSMACPHVAGLAALVWGQFPSLTRDEVQMRLYCTVDDLGVSGFDPHFGHGRINAKNAIEPQPDHELILWKWEHTPYARLNQDNNFTISVYNYGKTNEENVVVHLLANNSIVDSEVITQFATNTLEILILSWDPTVEGIYNVTALVVPVVGEKTTNNVVWVMMLAGARPSLRVPEDYHTIQDAVNVAMPGDTIEVAAGTYYESVWVLTPGLSFVGENKYTTIVDANGTTAEPFDLFEAGYISITGFTFQNGYKGGFVNWLGCGKNLNVSYNILKGSGGSVALWCEDSVIYGNLLISSKIAIDGFGNKVTNNLGGSIQIYYGKNNIVTNNEVSGRCWIEGNKTTVSHNVVTDIDYVGIRIKGEENIITDNEVTSGFIMPRGFLVSGKNNYIARNTITKVKGSAILLEDANECRFEDNTMIGTNYGIYLEYSCYNNTFRENTVKNCYNGIILSYSNNNTFIGSTVTNCSDKGIYILASNSNSFIYNTTVSECKSGIYICVSSDNLIAENVTLRNNEYGLFLEDSSNNRIYHNNIINNTYQLNQTGTCQNIWDHEGKGNYWSDYTGEDLNSDGVGDTMLPHQDVDYYPLMASFVSGPPPTYTLTITATADGTTNPSPGTYTYIQGQNVQVQAIPNTGFILNHWELDGANAGSANPFSLLMDNNHTLHAVFIRAYTLTITTTLGGTTNPAPGSYTYAVGSNISITAIPIYMFDHWELDNNNVGTTNPITITMNTDHTLHAVFVEYHDIAVTNVAPSKTVVGQSLCLNINVTVVNHGILPETFDVTLYATTTVIITQTITNLPAGVTQTLTFTWNTTGFAKGSYIISAYAWPVPGETNTTNNTFTDSFVIVAMMGDITGGTPDLLDFVPDGKVDMRDVGIVAKYFGQRIPPAPSNCDVSNDGQIDMRDIGLMARHFGESS